jgi:hypothetical protein
MAGSESEGHSAALLTDLYELSMLDAYYRLGMEQPAVFEMVSGSVDEYAIEAMRAAGAPVDVFCLGTRLSVSEDAPALDFAYKLQQYAGRARRKLSRWKETWPGPRQVYRRHDPCGCIAIDARRVASHAEDAGEGSLQSRQGVAAATCSWRSRLHGLRIEESAPRTRLASGRSHLPIPGATPCSRAAVPLLHHWSDRSRHTSLLQTQKAPAY